MQHLQILGIASILHIFLLIVTRESYWKLFGILGFPLLVLQRSHTILIDYPCLNQLHLLYKLSNMYTLGSIVLHGISFFLASDLHTLLVYPQGHYQPAMINQNEYYLFSTIVIAFLYAGYRAWTNKDRLTFASIQGRLWFRIKSCLLRSIKEATILAFGFTAVYSILYTIFGVWFFHQSVTWFHILGYKLGKQSFSFLTGLNPFLNGQLFLKLFRIFSIWETIHSLFNLFSTMPKEGDSIKSLEYLKVNHSENDFFSVCYNIETNTKYRQSLFDEINAPKSNLCILIDECLKQLKSITDNIIKASKEDVQFRKEKIDSIKNDSRNAYQYQKDVLMKKAQKETNSRLGTGSILVQRKKNIFETAANNAMSLLIEREDSVSYPVQKMNQFSEKTSRVPDILLPTNEPVTIAASTKLDSEKVKAPGSGEFLTALSKGIESVPFGKLFLQDTIIRESHYVFRDIQLSIWSCSILGKLYLSSITQDKYAQLSQKIPVVVATLLDLHSGIETWIKAKQSSSKPLFLHLFHEETCPPILKPFLSKHDANTVTVPYSLLVVVERTIFQIIGTFYNSMDRYRFDAAYVTKLQQFMDFNQ